MDSIFSPPSFHWVKDKAKVLRKAIGTKNISYWRATNLLCRMYGYAGWNELVELRSVELRALGAPLPTEWDDDLDEFYLRERCDRFVGELKAELDIDDDESMAILREVKVSGRELMHASTPFTSESVLVSDVDDFADRLTNILAALAPQIAAAGNSGRRGVTRNASARRR